MTALAADRATKRAGNQAKIINQRVALGTDIVYAGGMVGRLSTGLCVAAAATPGMRVLGVACETVDNSAAASGVYCEIMRGAFWFANSASTDEILDDHLGEKCYVVDDSTVAAVGAAGRPVAGRVMARRRQRGLHSARRERRQRRHLRRRHDRREQHRDAPRERTELRDLLPRGWHEERSHDHLSRRHRPGVAQRRTHREQAPPGDRVVSRRQVGRHRHRGPVIGAR
jgi:hypothetical protein